MNDKTAVTPDKQADDQATVEPLAAGGSKAVTDGRRAPGERKPDAAPAGIIISNHNESVELADADMVWAADGSQAGGEPDPDTSDTDALTTNHNQSIELA